MNVPESCVGHREVSGEALTGVSVGQPLSREITLIPSADAFIRRKATVVGALTRAPTRSAWSLEPGMSIRASFGNREVSSLAVREVCVRPASGR